MERGSDMTRSSGRANDGQGISRRTVLGAGVGAAALLGLTSHRGLAWPGDSRFAPSRPNAPENWRTWLLASGAELRPAAPGPATTEEIAELLNLQARTTGATAALVERWDGPAVLPWSRLTLDLIAQNGMNPPRAARLLALVHTAAADAVVAARDAQAAWRRPGPVGTVPGLVPL